MNLPKTDDNDKTYKNDVNTLYPMTFDQSFLGQVSHTNNSSHLFWNLEDPVLVQTLSNRRRTTCHLLLIGFSHQLIPLRDVGHNILHLNVAE